MVEVGGATRREVLIADDEAVADVVAEALRRIGYAVRTAVDRSTLLEQIRDRCPHLLLIDMSLPPYWNGLELAQNLTDRYPKLQTVLFTTHPPAPEIEEMARSAGIEHVVYKPFDLAEVESVVEEKLGV